jgi:hypothetical protein
MAMRFEALPPAPHPNKTPSSLRRSQPTSEVISKRREAAARIGKDLYAAIEHAIPAEHASRRTGRNESYDLSLIAKGGEHLVFELEDPKHAHVVYKINYLESRGVFDAWFRGPGQYNEAVRYMREDMMAQQERLRQLRQYFGRDAVPVQRLMVRDVPLTRQVIEQFDPRFTSVNVPLPDHIPAWVSIQKHLELPKEKTVSLNGYYPEYYLNHAKGAVDRIAKERKYDDAHDALVGYEPLDGEPVDHLEQVEKILDMYPTLVSVGIQILQDPTFKTALQKAVRDMIAYTKGTGIAMDLNGQNNVLLLEENGEWKLKMPDPLFSGDQPKMADLEYAASSLEKDEDLQDAVVRRVFNPLNTLRVINALAILAEIPDRLEIPGVRDIPPRRWRENITRVMH